ncbi:MAG: T9SS type A sorting domain-containing protein, partial [Flavobacteriales bacterium]
MKQFLLLICFVAGFERASAQLEKLYVETYYVSDENDATDIIGGGLEAGTVTYRIYADLLPGTQVLGLFGSAEYPFEISSTELFFNHESDGQSFAKEFLKARYQEGTVALDTWLTIGQTTKLQAGEVNFGIPKHQDEDGTFIGGINNDGGSELVAGGLLINEDATAGIPLTTADGMQPMDVSPADWFSYGILDFVSGEDTTMFGSTDPSSFFYSENFELSCSGVSGVLPDSNYVLLAQLTTKGELQFKFNLEVAYELDGSLITVQYVSKNEGTSDQIVFSPYLTYPYACGCTDPNYAEYDPTVICEEEGACATPVVFGCLDEYACNYNPEANYHVDALCCYPGYCPGDLQTICPQLMGEDIELSVYPNPAAESITVSLLTGADTNIQVDIINAYGTVLTSESLDLSVLYFLKTYSIGDFLPGLYTVKVTTTYGTQTKM